MRRVNVLACNGNGIEAIDLGPWEQSEQTTAWSGGPGRTLHESPVGGSADVQTPPLKLNAGRIPEQEPAPVQNECGQVFRSFGAKGHLTG